MSADDPSGLRPLAYYEPNVDAPSEREGSAENGAEVREEAARVDFIETQTQDEKAEATRIFDVQWRWVHGRATEAEVRGLPETFRGLRVVRNPETLDRLGNEGQFADLAERYRELLG